VLRFVRHRYLLSAIVLLIVIGLATATGILARRLSELDRQLSQADRRVSSLIANLNDAEKQAATSEARAAAQRAIAALLQHKLRKQPPCRGPHVWLSPDQGPIGTHVAITGYCFVGQDWSQWRGAYGMFLLHQFIEPRECELIIGVGDPVLRISRSGRAEGSFTVPGGEGGCFQQRYEWRITPASYSLGIQCHACLVADFRVTPRSPPGRTAPG
jgi:hypothetical protein